MILSISVKNSEVLELVRQKGFHPYEYMLSFEKFNRHCLEERSFIVLWQKN